MCRDSIAGSGLQCGEIGQDLGAVPRRIADLVGLDDRSVGIDEVADAFRVVGERVVTGPEHVVGGADAAVLIGQEVEREVELRPEGRVVLRSVEGDTDDGAPGGCIVLGLVTQALSFERSTGGVRFRVPPEQEPVASFRGEIEDVAGVVDGGEGRCVDSRLEHVRSPVCALDAVRPATSMLAGGELRLRRVTMWRCLFVP